MRFHFWVHQPPVPKARPRFNRKTGRAYTLDTTVEYERGVGFDAKAAARARQVELPLNGPLGIDVIFYLSKPKSAKKREWPIVRPDLDNYVKAVWDGIGHAGIWHDDAQVCLSREAKVYTVDEPPRAFVAIRTLSPHDRPEDWVME